jgi:NgoMIV restriction enzyme
MNESAIGQARRQFHATILDDLLVFDTFKFEKGLSKGEVVPCASNADGGSESSRFVANHIASQLGAKAAKKLAGQTAGNRFEQSVAEFIRTTFSMLGGIRPGNWEVLATGGRGGGGISNYEQFEHMETLRLKSEADAILQASLGNDYTISPDIIVSRARYQDAEINQNISLVDGATATRASIRSAAGESRIMHASISCKWTMRSDRAQNSRSEALNLIRNRKGRVPHIVAVVGEPTPSRLSSIALGTGDLDCVYHFALYELQNAVEELGQSEAENLLAIMIEGKRLKDISDLPLDLAV